MKKLVFIFVIVSFFASCNNDDDSNSQDSDLVGDWKLIEMYISEGSINGTFSPVVSNKTISFLNNGIINSNGSLCHLTTSVGNPTSGTYFETESYFITDACTELIPNLEFSFEINGNTLIISYPCIEPCLVKYEKL
jgi:hypothetical protein